MKKEAPSLKKEQPEVEINDNTIIKTDRGDIISVGEIKHSKRIRKSATPKGGIDWYIKWIASIIMISSMSMRGVEGLQFYDLGFSVVGVSLWLVVSILWNDRALITVNAVGLMLLLNTLVRTIAGAW
mgnify:CR=1 FL=1